MSDLDFGWSHPSIDHFEGLFDYSHLPENLLDISRECAELAERMVWRVGHNPELSAGLRKLLEAKDCFVRAELVGNKQ